ncbi:MAG: SUMF1/EgtB/PvdO family nonheme iron enzyme [Clostridia bacterium]|nr:SUMF1/EgtB/PvdO family nonheme iron enzyme [Clostridia bacterium]
MTKNDLQQQFPSNHILTDQNGKPSVMVYVKKFFLDEVIDGASHLPHPAFIVDGKELDGIYISKFQNVIIDGLAYSLPDRDPATRVDFDTASNACSAKGNGFHIMTAMEWGAIALWCQKNDCLPFGNNDMGKDIRETDTVARISYYNKEQAVCRTATGTGSTRWSHNGQSDGIYDLNANVWEWVGGIRLFFGELQILPNNNGASGAFSQSATSKDWCAIDGTNGAFLLPDGNGTTKNSIKLDSVNGCWTYISGNLTSACNAIRFCKFADVATDASVCEQAKEILYSLGVLPCPAYGEKEVFLYANNGARERIPFRGGRWGQGLNSGVFKTCFDDPRTYSGDAVGFRSAYYETESP